MKTILLFAILLVFSCSEDHINNSDNNVVENEPQPKIVAQYQQFAEIHITELFHLTEDDLITQIVATTNFGQLHYEILGQTLPDAFKINATTGAVMVKDPEALKLISDAIIVDVKVSNGDIVQNIKLQVTLNADISNTCNNSENKNLSVYVNFLWDNRLSDGYTNTNNYQFIFSVDEDVIMCAFKMDHQFLPFITGDIQRLYELIDDEGNVLFNATLNGCDWCDTSLWLQQLEINLKKEHEYTLIITQNNGDFYLNTYTIPDNSNISFPIELGDINIIETNYTDINGEKQTNKNLPLVVMGLVAI